MSVTTKKQEFIDRVKGKPIGKDMFGQTISLGDWLIWGAGSQSASALNFGRVVKINYNKEKYSAKEAERVSSITVVKMEKANTWRNKDNDFPEYGGYTRAKRKASCSSYKSAMVLSEPPNKIAEVLLGDIDIPKE